jgi:hypothetical protein
MRARYKDTEKERALRRWVANRLRKDVPQTVWEKVKDWGYVDDALNPNDPYRPEELVDEVKELIRFAILVNEEIQDSLIGSDDGPLQRQEDEARVNPFAADRPIHNRRWSFMSLQRQDEASVIPASADDPVRKRGEAFTLYLAKMAAADRLVKQFRQRVLGGGTVSYNEAAAFVDSPAAAVFSLEWFEENGVPFIGHKAQVLEGSDWPPEEHSHVRGRIKVGWDCEELVSSFAGVTPFRSLQVLLVGAGSVWFHELEVLEDSVLGVLSKLAQQTWRYPWWHPVDIPIFVLMGVARIVGQPYTKQIESRSRLYEPITINVPPWFSVENVSQIYKSLKKDLPTTPQPSPRRLTLFEFVMKQPEITVPGEGGIPKVPSWAALVRSWNESLPAGHEWRYKDRRNLRRDFLKAFDQIVNYYRGTA